MNSNFEKMMKNLSESNHSLMMEYFHDEIRTQYVPRLSVHTYDFFSSFFEVQGLNREYRTDNLKDKMENKQLKLELQSLKELNSNLKKTLEQAKADSSGQMNDVNEGGRVDLTRIKDEPKIPMVNTPSSNPSKKRKLSSSSITLEFR